MCPGKKAFWPMNAKAGSKDFEGNGIGIPLIQPIE
jgi:hypothetical protein